VNNQVKLAVVGVVDWQPGQKLGEPIDEGAMTKQKNSSLDNSTKQDPQIAKLIRCSNIDIQYDQEELKILNLVK
jgi:hypothetical protein